MFDDELLIECVRIHEEIYSPSHKLYNDSVHKQNVWKSIGAQLNKSGQDCKTRWIYLRDQFKKFLNRRKFHGKTGVYKYEENLKFLIPFFNERDKKRAEKCGVQENHFELILDDISINHLPNFDENNKELEKIDQKSKRKREIVETTSTIASNIELIRVKRDDEIDENLNPPEFVNTQNYGNCNEQDNSNQIDAFFAAMAATVKTFSPLNQVIAKSKIFSVISSLEMKQIQQEVGETVNEEND